MRYSIGNDFETNPLGIYITLAEASGPAPSFSVDSAAMYRKDVTFRFPPSSRGERHKQMIPALKLIQGGCRWAIHFERDNMNEHLSASEVRLLEEAFPMVTFICHETTASHVASLSPEELEKQRKKQERKARHNEKMRLAYHKRKARSLLGGGQL